MPLLALTLMIAGMASLFLSMGAAYLAAPKLKAWLKRQSPTVDVPEFDFGDQRGTQRLNSLLWTVKIPPGRPRLHRLVLAHRALLVAAPLLLGAGMMAGMLLTNADGKAQRPERGAPPSIMLTVSDGVEPGP